MASPAKPTLVILALDKEPAFDEMHRKMLATLSSKASIREFEDSHSAHEYISSDDNGDVAGIFATNARIFTWPDQELHDSIKSFVTVGGTFVVGGLAPEMIVMGDLKEYFNRQWGQPWAAGHCCSISLQRNAGFSNKTMAGLVPKMNVKALALRNVPREDMVYTSDDYIFSEQSPVVLARHGAGYVGWIGELNADPNCTTAIINMFGL